ncbi:IclR family transcriptional regulator domain-containing protein [Aeromicrobium wangtongii]|uniref:IclR family transcriptional regulator domain-containing protein n=1 Tax=Aeromicrobium wangtongii TaxID=2969247 RepID=UPI0020181CD9|nr:IclR family transcriptional regulator C-terminal domain-containing protein [Aeromicrobium wangtongii]MCL3816952.1 VOC family protein [Aeromicrobium wangtongii]
MNAEKHEGGSPGMIAKIAVVIDLLTIHDDLSIAGLADLAGEPRSSMYRLVNGLTAAGFVEPGSRKGRVRLGAKLFKIGAAAGRRYDIRRLALPILTDLREQTEVTAHLCVREDFSALCVERVEGKGSHLLSLRTGTSIPLHLGAAAKVLLAHAGPALWDAYIQYVSEGGGTPDIIRNVVEDQMSPRVAELNEEMAEIRRSGVSVSNSDVVLGVAALGAPVRDRDGNVCAAISIGGEARHVLGDAAERNERHVRSAARQLSAALGFVPQVALPSPAEPPSLPILGPLTHVGLVVRDLESAVAKHSFITGDDGWRNVEYSPATVHEMTYMGMPAPHVVRAAFSDGPGRRIDLVSPQSGPSIHRDWLDERGEGLHYANFNVPSLADAVATMAAHSVSLAQSGTGVTTGVEVAYGYFDTVKELGYWTRASER